MKPKNDGTRETVRKIKEQRTDGREGEKENFDVRGTLISFYVASRSRNRRSCEHKSGGWKEHVLNYAYQ